MDHDGKREDPPTGNHLRDTLAQLVGLPTSEITGDANLVFLGLTSLEMMRLVTRWRRQGLPVSFETMAATPTFDAWDEHLKNACSAREESPGS